MVSGMDALGPDSCRQVRLYRNARLRSRQLVGEEISRSERSGDTQPLVPGSEKYGLVFRPRTNIGKPVGGSGTMTRPGPDGRQPTQAGHVVLSAAQHARENFAVNAAGFSKVLPRGADE